MSAHSSCYKANDSQLSFADFFYMSFCYVLHVFVFSFVSPNP